jgi:aspartyl protease family protein
VTRPIIWAAGSFLALGVAASLAGNRLASLSGDGPTLAPTASPLPVASRPATAPQAGRTVTVAGDRRGHFLVETAVDGRRLSMLVDTGASVVALTAEDAAAAGLRPFPSDFTRRISTANGEVAVAAVRIRELRIGDIHVRNVEAVVMPAGRLGVSLLGMSFLRQLRSFDISDGRLTLRG